MTKAMPFLQKAILLSYDPRPFMPDGFLRNVIDQILFFLVCRLRKALYLQCS